MSDEPLGSDLARRAGPRAISRAGGLTSAGMAVLTPGLPDTQIQAMIWPPIDIIHA
jgi:hypothetical protein